jgi:transcriptional regulator with XRE-family HTH domain
MQRPSTHTELQARLNQHIGQQIKALRHARGLTQQKLGTELGVSYQQLQKYERGTSRASTHVLYLLASLFGEEMVYFFNTFEPQTAIAPLPATRENENQLAKKLVRAFRQIEDRETQMAVVRFVGVLGPGDTDNKPVPAGFAG